jgi:3-carboxy-cis,cis-muconate cycloisomerase
MRANIESVNGVIFAERAAALLAPKLGRDAAHKIMEAATRKCAAEGRRLADVLREIPEVTDHLDRATLEGIENPEEYLGSAEAFRMALLSRDKNDTEEKER